MSTITTSEVPQGQSPEISLEVSGDNPGGNSQKSIGFRLTRFSQRVLPLAPAVIMVLVFMAGPIVWAIYSSFTNAALTGPNAANPKWIGLENYAQMMRDPVFPMSVWLTIVFVLVSAVIGQNCMGMGLALLMSKGNKTVNAIVGAVIVTAWVLPEIVAAFTMYAFFVDAGTFNQVIGLIGVNGPNWLYDFPMVAIILANIWRGTAFSMMVYRAALDDVSQDVVEAAQIDGATSTQRLFKITLPIIKNSIATNLMLITLQTLSVFTLVFVMTAGGPANKSMTLPVYAYEQAFKFFNVGYGSAVAVVMILVGVIFAIFYVRLLKPGKD